MIRVDARIKRGHFRLDARLEADARVAGLFGPSGCGKTTLLHAIAGLLRPREGLIAVDDVTLFSSAQRIDVPPEKRATGFVFQDDRLFPHRSVRGNLLSGRPGRNSASTGPSLREVAALLGLERLLDRPVSSLSGGEARRVAIGRALLCRPRLVILDEPLAGLDAELRRRVLAYLVRLKRSLEVRMLYVSHTFSDFLALVDTMAVIRDGAIAATGAPEALLARSIDEAEAGPLETTVSGTVEAVDRASGLVTVRCNGTALRLPLPEARAGDEAFVTVGAHEALLAVGEAPRTSARNTLAGRILNVEPTPCRVVVCVDVGWPLWVEVTAAASRELQLDAGKPVFVLLKSRSLRGVVFPSLGA